MIKIRFLKIQIKTREWFSVTSCVKKVVIFRDARQYIDIVLSVRYSLHSLSLRIIN